MLDLRNTLARSSSIGLGTVVDSVPSIVPGDKSKRSSTSPIVSIPKALQNYALVKLLIWKKILILTDGRDKTLKVFQYGAKVLLWLSVPASKSTAEAKAKLLASHFSLVRKVLRLGHVLEPFHDGLELTKKQSFVSLADKLEPLNVAIGIVNDLSDE
jgi:hypothetical protein